jgi:hypothetical protein
MGGENGAFAALAAAPGVVVVQLALGRRVAAVGMTVENLMQVSRQVVSELKRTGHDGIFDGVLAELLVAALVKEVFEITGLHHGKGLMDWWMNGYLDK